jgi:hypothetical protein
MPLTQADVDAVVNGILTAKLGSSGPNVAVALQHASGLPGAADIAKAVVAALPPGSTGNLTAADITKAVQAGLATLVLHSA